MNRLLELFISLSRPLLVFIVMAATMAGSNRSFAIATIPNATFSLGVDDDTYYPAGIYSYTAGTLTVSDATGSGTATITQGSDPSVLANATGSATYSAQAGGATAKYTYWFEVLGSSGNVPVLVNANGGATASSSNPTGGSAYILVGNYGFGETISTSASDLDPTFSINQTTDVAANTFQEVVLYASAGVKESGDASAYVDPQISIDPSLIADGYSLIFSPNFLPQSSGVPDGGTTFGLLGIALAGLFAAHRKFACAP
jgi:VPDSG-CTERM motif